MVVLFETKEVEMINAERDEQDASFPSPEPLIDRKRSSSASHNKSRRIQRETHVGMSNINSSNDLLSFLAHRLPPLSNLHLLSGLLALPLPLSDDDLSRRHSCPSQLGKVKRVGVVVETVGERRPSEGEGSSESGSEGESNGSDLVEREWK